MSTNNFDMGNALPATHDATSQGQGVQVGGDPYNHTAVHNIMRHGESEARRMAGATNSMEFGHPPNVLSSMAKGGIQLAGIANTPGHIRTPHIAGAGGRGVPGLPSA